VARQEAALALIRKTDGQVAAAIAEARLGAGESIVFDSGGEYRIISTGIVNPYTQVGFDQ
jgi:hypothetical protein